jgi:hypothetical protein
MELARHRLPGSTFDSLLQEALQACGPESDNGDGSDPEQQENPADGALASPRSPAMPVVLTPAPEAC